MTTISDLRAEPDNTPVSPRVYMDAVLTPTSGMSATGLRVFAFLMGLPLALMAVSFAVTGALPVLGFLGAEAVALAIAFALSFQAKRVMTSVRVTTESVHMQHVAPGKRVMAAILPAYFTRVEVEASRHGAVRLSAAGRAYRIGAFMSLEERLGFAEALRSALEAARAERHDGELGDAKAEFA